MKKIKALMPEAYDFNGKLPLKQAIPLGLQHVMAMFVGNLTPLLIITGACGIGAGSEYASSSGCTFTECDDYRRYCNTYSVILNRTYWW